MHSLLLQTIIIQIFGCHTKADCFSRKIILEYAELFEVCQVLAIILTVFLFDSISDVSSSAYLVKLNAEIRALLLNLVFKQHALLRLSNRELSRSTATGKILLYCEITLTSNISELIERCLLELHSY